MVSFISFVGYIFGYVFIFPILSGHFIILCAKADIAVIVLQVFFNLVGAVKLMAAIFNFCQWKYEILIQIEEITKVVFKIRNFDFAIGYAAIKLYINCDIMKVNFMNGIEKIVPLMRIKDLYFIAIALYLPSFKILIDSLFKMI